MHGRTPILPFRQCEIVLKFKTATRIEHRRSAVYTKHARLKKTKKKIVKRPAYARDPNA